MEKINWDSLQTEATSAVPISSNIPMWANVKTAAIIDDSKNAYLPTISHANNNSTSRMRGKLFADSLDFYNFCLTRSININGFLN